MGVPSPELADGSRKRVSSLPRGWTLSRVPGPLLLVQLLLDSGTPRQDVLSCCSAWLSLTCTTSSKLLEEGSCCCYC